MKYHLQSLVDWSSWDHWTSPWLSGWSSRRDTTLDSVTIVINLCRFLTCCFCLIVSLIMSLNRIWLACCNSCIASCGGSITACAFNKLRHASMNVFFTHTLTSLHGLIPIQGYAFTTGCYFIYACLENSLHSSKTLNLHQMDRVIWYWGLIMQIKAQFFWAIGSYNTHRLPCRLAQWLETSQVGFGSFLLLWKVSLSQKRLAYNYCRQEELIWEFYCIFSLKSVDKAYVSSNKPMK